MRRRRLVLAFGVTVFVALVVSAHAFFAARLFLDPRVPEPFATIGVLAITVLGSLIFVYPLSDRLLGARIGRIFAWPTMLWLGTAFYLLLALWTSDFILQVGGWHGLEAERSRAIAVAAFTLCIVLGALRSGTRRPPVKRVELELASWPRALDGYRIVQISDVHIGPTLRRRFAQQLVERCNALAPDLLAITGDLVDGSVHFLHDEVAPFAELRARDGVYFVTGNHDHYSNARSWVKRVRELGIRVLRNERVPIARGDGFAFELAGVDDLSSRGLDAGHEHDLGAALEGWNGTVPLVLLAHDPRTFEQAFPRRIDLQLSGHTHGGQLWPFSWLVRLQTRYVAGVYRRERSLLYVSRGTGYWGPPMRFFAPAEITELTLRGPRS